MKKTSTVSDLYCFALVLTRNPSQATSLVEESVQEILRKGGEDSIRRMRWHIFQKIRKKALCQTTEREEGKKENISDILVALHMLPEPSRSAMTLFCLESFSLQDLESFLNLSTQELGVTLEIARTNLKRLLSIDN